MHFTQGHSVPNRTSNELRPARSLAATVFAIVAISAVVAGVGCTKDSVISGIGAPGTSLAAEVGAVMVRHRYLDASVSAGDFQYRFFFPDEARCRDLLNHPEGASFVWLGPLGRVARGEERCSPVGILSLQAWRDRGPRLSREPVPRAQAVFTEVWRDQEMVLVRGRFPLAGMANWIGGHDSIAILPNVEDCLGFLEEGVTSMEFHASGKNPLVLLNEDGLCPITGFAQPLP